MNEHQAGSNALAGKSLIHNGDAVLIEPFRTYEYPKDYFQPDRIVMRGFSLVDVTIDLFQEKEIKGLFKTYSPTGKADVRDISYAVR